MSGTQTLRGERIVGDSSNTTTKWHNGTHGTASRNTKVRTRARCWALTINNYTQDEVNELLKLKNKLDDYAWQSEVGESGTPHLQVALKYHNPIEFNTLKKLFPRANIQKAENWQALRNYCSKTDTSDGEISEIHTKNGHIRDPLGGKNLYSWQEEVLGILSEQPDERTINWFWETDGNMGKTSLAKSICLKYDNVLFLTGKSSDMKYGVYKWLDSHKGKDLHAIIINYVRSLENFVSYQGIEEVKDGIFYNTKYECEMCIYNSPHIIIFANFMPDTSRLSIDRWNIKKINSDGSTEQSIGL